jgi:hypothetical protein
MGKTDRERQQRRRAKLHAEQERRRQIRGLRTCPHCTGWLDVSVYSKAEWDRFSRTHDQHKAAGTEMPVETLPVKLVDDVDICMFVHAATDENA